MIPAETLQKETIPGLVERAQHLTKYHLNPYNLGEMGETAQLLAEFCRRLIALSEYREMEIAEGQDSLNWLLCKCVDAISGGHKNSVSGEDFRKLPGQIAALLEVNAGLKADNDAGDDVVKSLRSNLAMLSEEREKELREFFAFLCEKADVTPRGLIIPQFIGGPIAAFLESKKEKG